MGEAFHQKTSRLEAENLKPMGRSRRKKINGTSKNDVLTGTKRNDLIKKKTEDDTITNSEDYLPDKEEIFPEFIPIIP